MDTQQKSYTEYWQLGNEMQQQNPVLAFYLKTYACEFLNQQYKIKKQAKDPSLVEVTKTLKQILNELESLKSYISAQLQNKDQNKQQIIYMINGNLAQARQELDQGRLTPQLKQTFERNAIFIDILQQFGPLSQELVNIRNQAQKYAAEILARINAQQKTQQDNFGVGGPVQYNQIPIQTPNNQTETPPEDTYLKEAYNKLSICRADDSDIKSIQRIMEITQGNLNTTQKNTVKPMEKIKSIYHPPNQDLFNPESGMPETPQVSDNLNNDYNFGTPNPDLLQQSNLKKLNNIQLQTSNNQLYNNVNPDSFKEPPKNYFFKSNEDNSNQNTFTPTPTPGSDQIGNIPPMNQFKQNILPPPPAGNVQIPPKQLEPVKPNIINATNNPPLIVPANKSSPQQNSLIYKSNGLIKIQVIKLCEHIIQQAKSGQNDAIKQSLKESIKLLDDIKTQ